MRRFAWTLLRAATPFLALPVLLAFACIGRLGTTWRRLFNKKPRLVWGSTPIVNLKYWSQAMRGYGYKSSTVVDGVYPAHSADDFDITIDDFPFSGGLLSFLRPYIVFAWALVKFDVFSVFFFGFFLGRTPLAFIECQLLRIAGKKLVVSPFGSDVAVPDNLGVFRESMLTSYPYLIDVAAQTKRRVLYYSKWADFVVRNMQVGYIPRHDMDWVNQLGVDTDLWRGGDSFNSADGHENEVVVVHSSNHRSIKGTDALIDAVEELRADRLNVRLVLMEGRTNEEVRKAVIDCDIVADQFIGGYGMAAIEGMSAGKPVLSNLSWHDKDLIESTCLKDCPIIDTPMEKIKENLRALVEDPQLRRQAGLASREYILKYHSYEAIGRVWDSICRYVWRNDPVDYSLVPWYG